MGRTTSQFYHGGTRWNVIPPLFFAVRGVGDDMITYLLHFATRIAPGRHTTQHYIGSCEDLARRIQQHRTGQGSRLCEVALARGITFTVARTWESPDRSLERKLKNRHNGPGLCPICAEARGKELRPEELETLLSFSLDDVTELAF